MKILEPFTFKSSTFQNRVVMAPMNRRRSFNNIPSASMSVYYTQRATAGLIITDNIAVSSDGVGYLNTPGIYNNYQKEAWKPIIDAVHRRGGKIVAQLVHNGRIGHVSIQNNEPLVAPSVIQADDEIKTPDGEHRKMSLPRELKTEEVRLYVDRFVEAAKSAIEIGFDAVEIHAAHGFLIDQFLNSNTNLREDIYGGNRENRIRFLSDIMKKVVSSIGPDKTGIRLSPFKTFYGAGSYKDEKGTHLDVVKLLAELDVLYIHFSNEFVDGAPSLTREYLLEVREIYSNIIMSAGGYTLEFGNLLIEEGFVDMIAYGRPFISNPDLVFRFKNNVPLAEWDESTFYQGGNIGYIDYPTFLESIKNKK